jgi:hypothetical protein
MPIEHRQARVFPVLVAAVGGLLAACLGGCGRRLPPVAAVSGSVTIDGRPVSGGIVMFHPGRGRSAVGTTDAAGRYTLTTFRPGDGAILGRHTVTIDAREDTEGPALRPMSAEEEFQKAEQLFPTHPRVRWVVPERYSVEATTPLEAIVEPTGNRLDFPLLTAENGKNRNPPAP